MKKILHLFLGLTLFACSDKRTNQNIKNQDSTIIARTTSIANQLNDSLSQFSLSNIEKNIARQLVLDSLFYTVEDISFLLRNNLLLSKHELNDNILYEVIHRNELGKSKAEREIDYRTTDLMLFDKRTEKNISNYRLLGCHYNSYNINIIDWDNNGTDEIKAELSFPTQSVPVIDHFFDIIQFDILNKKLKKIISLDTDDRDCHFSNETDIGIQTLTKYSFIAKEKLQIIENYYSFKCEDFDFDKPIKSKHLDSTKTKIMLWDRINYEYQ